MQSDQAKLEEKNPGNHWLMNLFGPGVKRSNNHIFQLNCFKLISLELIEFVDEIRSK